MSTIRLPKDLESAKTELLCLLRGLLMGRFSRPLMVFPGFPLDEVGGAMTRSDSQLSNISEYLDVERSKSLHSALKKCTRTLDEKKVVSFADAMGLDLCQVRPVFPYNTSDEDILGTTPPLSQTMPTVRSTSRPRQVAVSPSGSLNCPRYLHLRSAHFPPWRDPVLINRELVQKAKLTGVCLKSSNVIGMTFSGIVIVRNVAFDKKVHVRYSLDEWRTHIDISANYISSNTIEQLDNFSFSIFLPPTIPVGAKCEFCIRFQAAGRDYWDNNDGRNYVLEVRTMADSYVELTRDFEQPTFY